MNLCRCVPYLLCFFPLSGRGRGGRGCGERGIARALVMLACAWGSGAQAQVATYPAKPVRVIVPMAAGSPMEVPLRAIGQVFSETTGQSFVIDNRPGAGGTIGTEAVAKAPRDGYTALFFSCAYSSNVYHYKKLPYNPVADFVPISLVDETYGNLLLVHPSVPARSIKEFIALAKARPSQLNYASAGVGSTSHTNAALFTLAAGIQLTHVPYKGTSVAMNDLVGGQVELMFGSATTAAPHIKSGRLHALGIGGPIRQPLLPDVPTFHEAGLTGFSETCWHGMWFPAGVPADVTRRMSSIVTKAVALPEVRKRMEENGFVPKGTSPEEFADFLAKNLVHAASVAQKTGVKPQ